MLLRAADTFFVAATIPDSTPYWGDDFVVSMSIRGKGGANPDHDDFQWYLRRTLDSTFIYRGRGGHWEAPRGDPDWRLGPERSGLTAVSVEQTPSLWGHLSDSPQYPPTGKAAADERR